MTDFHVPVWGYFIMALGLLAFLALLVKYIRRNKGLKRPIFASPYILWIVIFTVVPCLLVAYYAFTTTENTPRYSFTLQGHKAQETVMLNPDNDGQNIEFKNTIQYTAEDIGLHRYTITEVDHHKDNAAENKIYSFVVEVKEDKNGNVKATSTLDWTDFRKMKVSDNQLIFKGTRAAMPDEPEGTRYSYTLSGHGIEETIIAYPGEEVVFSPLLFSLKAAPGTAVTQEIEKAFLFDIVEKQLLPTGEVITVCTNTYKVTVNYKAGREQPLKINSKPQLMTNFTLTKASKDSITFKGKSALTLKELKMSSIVFSLDNFKQFFDSNYAARKVTSSQNFSTETFTEAKSDTIDTLVFSLWMAFLCTLFCLLLGYPAAHIMADREFKLGATLVILFVVPMWMNFLLRTIALMNLMEDNGLINNILEWLGFGRRKLLNNAIAIQVGMVYNFLPFMVFPIYNALNKMDYKLSEAAMDLGCNKWQTFYKVTLPLSLPGVVSGITMVFMPAVTTFYISRLLGGGKLQLFGDLIEAKFLSSNLSDWNIGSAMSLIMMILILLSLGLLQKVDPDGEGGGMV